MGLGSDRRKTSGKEFEYRGKISQAAILDAEGTNIMSMTKEELLALFT